MGPITLGVIAVTAVMILLGFLLGLLRGTNRAILRFVLVIGSIVGAVLLRDTLADFIMNMEFSGSSVKQTILEFISSDAALPEAIQNLVVTLVEILIGVASFIVLLLAFIIVSWIVIFPICKIFIPSNGLRLIGGALGIIQGLAVAFAICAPVTGLLIQVDKIAEVKIQGEVLFEIPEEVGADEYLSSAPGKIYKSTGGWFFNMVSSKEGADGNNVSIEDACDVVVAVSGISDTVTQLSDKIENVTNAATPTEQVDALKNVGDSLISIGENLDNLSDDAKTMVNDLVDSVKEMVGGESEDLSPEMQDFFENFNIEELDLVSVGEAMNGMASYIEKTSDEFENDEPVTQEEITQIVNGFADNKVVVDLIVGNAEEVPQLLEVDEENKEKFTSAIEGTSLPQEDKDTLLKLFGLYIQ